MQKAAATRLHWIEMRENKILPKLKHKTKLTIDALSEIRNERENKIILKTNNDP